MTFYWITVMVENNCITVLCHYIMYFQPQCTNVHGMFFQFGSLLWCEYFHRHCNHYISSTYCILKSESEDVSEYLKNINIYPLMQEGKCQNQIPSFTVCQHGFIGNLGQILISLHQANHKILAKHER